MVIVCSESLGWDIYNSKKKGLFLVVCLFVSLKLTWKPVALCLFLLHELVGFFLVFLLFFFLTTSLQRTRVQQQSLTAWPPS